MSLPPTINSKRLPRNSYGCISRVASPLASIDTKSLPGFPTRSCHNRVKYSKQESISWRPSSLDSTMPSSCPAVTTSDQRVSFRRSSNGKSNKVASIWVVSSMETVSTQSNVSPTGNASRIVPARSRIVDSSSLRFGGATTADTVARCSSCFGGSVEINILKALGSACEFKSTRGPNAMPWAEENRRWLVSIAIMSSNFVIDQKRPVRSCSER